jgi:hypothetical protein
LGVELRFAMVQLPLTRAKILSKLFGLPTKLLLGQILG